MIIGKTDLPDASVLYLGRTQFHYIDSYGGTFNDPDHSVLVDDLAHAFAQPPPRWVSMLMKLRNLIAAMLGLKTGSIPDEKPCSPPYRSGDKLGFFRLYERTATEIILGENDNHLDFRVSVFMGTNENNPAMKTVVVSTAVTYNNWMGPVYFFFVKPLHRLIVPASLRRSLGKGDARHETQDARRKTENGKLRISRRG